MNHAVLTLSKAEIETLTLLVENGPIWAGDMPSGEVGRSLRKYNLAVSILVNGEDGYTAATAMGSSLYRQYYGTALGGAADTVAEAMAMRLPQRLISRVSSIS